MTTMYQVVSVTERYGKREVTVMTDPMDHHSACVVLSKCGTHKHKDFRYQLQTVEV